MSVNVNNNEEENVPYIRIGTNYYKKVRQPLISNDYIEKLVPWKRETIKEDHGNEIFAKILKYDGYCVFPDHIHYQRIIRNNNSQYSLGSYNCYEPIPHQLKEGSIQTTVNFIKHIFGMQHELGLDFINILYKHPTQILPVLCLVSTERHTGKTTFLNWLKQIFGANMILNRAEDFNNNFNSGWVNKLIIGVDELMLNKQEDTEKIKNLATTRSIQSEAKGKDKLEVEFFGKFIFTSNMESNFLKIDKNEIRFWVRKVPRLSGYNLNILEDLKNEIPAFLFYLKNREIATKNKSRMWFSPEEIRTDALLKVINGSKTKIEIEIIQIIEDLIKDFEIEEVKVTPKELLEKLASNHIRPSLSQVKHILQDVMQKKPKNKPERYVAYSWSLDNNGTQHVIESSRTGRYYTFSKDDIRESL